MAALTIGDRVRDALGTDAGCVEEARVLSATAYPHLPLAAFRRLGARPGQKNLLVRVALRDLDETLTSQAANALRDRIYRRYIKAQRASLRDQSGRQPTPAATQAPNRHES
jgi:hypothetical protein